LRLAAGAAVVLVVAAVQATATVRIQQDAIALGYANASNCGYCHTFDSNHMQDKAKEQGITVARLDCYACHRNRLPKAGPRLLNARGLYLTNAKSHFRADKVDAAWLKAYREPSPHPSPTVRK
jgi:cytochrome c2